MRTFLVAAAAVCLAGVAGAQGPPVGLPQETNSSVQARVTYPGGVVGLLDLTYSTVRGYRPLKLDLYYSPDVQEARPAVIWLHGGGWMAGNPRSGTEATGERDRLLARIAARGYVTVGLTYRFSDEAKFPAAVNDVKAAVRWLRANAAAYHIDPKRIAVWGASAGGYLATLTGTSCGIADLEGDGGNAGQSSCVQAVIDWFGPIDLKLLAEHSDPGHMISNFLGCEVTQCPAATLQRANPLSYISANSPPFLIMHGDADMLVPIAQSRMLLEALRAKGVAARMETIHGANHEWGGVGKAQIDAIYAMVQSFLDSTFATHGPGSL